MAEIIFNGPDGRLEGRYHKAKRSDAPIAIVLHPHPLHGGNMNNPLSLKLHKFLGIIYWFQMRIIGYDLLNS